MLAKVVDAVVGGDTQRDTHALELTAPNGVTTAAVTVGNDDRGCAEALAIEAELTVVEIERPRRGERRRGKSDPIRSPGRSGRVTCAASERRPGCHAACRW
jgi:hypothetical protein